MGRPSLLTPELAAEICERLRDREGNLSDVCRDEDMPERQTVIRWTNENPEFNDNYARARQAGYELMAEKVAEISDDGTNDWVEREHARTGNVQILVDHDHVTRSRLRVDTRKWLLSKVLPKIYGERTAVELTGADGGPVRIDDTERAARLDAIFAAIERRIATDGSDLV